MDLQADRSAGWPENPATIPLALALAVALVGAGCVAPNPGFRNDDAGAPDAKRSITDGLLSRDSDPLSLLPDAGPVRCINDAHCAPAHTRGGRCVEGKCVDLGCEDNWGNCNDDWSDGCEVDLMTNAAHCKACNTACPWRPNASAACEAGKCVLACAAPYEDCNEDPSDGCEIPVGQPNSCSRYGLTTFTSSSGATPAVVRPTAVRARVGTRASEPGTVPSVPIARSSTTAARGASRTSDSSRVTAVKTAASFPIRSIPKPAARRPSAGARSLCFPPPAASPVPAGGG